MKEIAVKFRLFIGMKLSLDEVKEKLKEAVEWPLKS